MHIRVGPAQEHFDQELDVADERARGGLELPRVAHGEGRGSSLIDEDEPVPARTRDAFRWAALLANFAAYGAATSIVNHYPLLNRELGRTGAEYGVVVGAVFFDDFIPYTRVEQDKDAG